jgi:hypothetical protein
VWLTAFLDLPAERFERAVDFWRAVTATGLSAPRGEFSQFATLLPGDGDAFLRVQRLGAGPARLHLDVHRDSQGERLMLASPGGLPYCEVSPGESVRPAPITWPGGHRSLVDQVCVDIPADRWDEECAFWARSTGWELVSGTRPEFRALVRPLGIPLRILLQRLDEPTGPVRAHLDLATTDRAAETRRHIDLGATLVGQGPRWTVLRDLAGLPYCVTDRDPDTGLLPPA